MKYLSVCSGIEAASVAWEPLGFTPVAFSEIEPFPSAVLARRFPDIPNLGDMTNYENWNLGTINLLVGGTPCQAFSLAGQRRSLDDARGNLCLTFCGIADKFDPEWILWENVPGILSTRDNAFGCFLGALCGSDQPILHAHRRGHANCGVVSGPRRTVAWRTLDAQWFGVPQRRRRVFVLAVRGADKFRCADALLPFGESLPGHLETCRKPGKKTTAHLGNSPEKSHWDGGPHPTLGAISTGVGFSDQELFSQRGAYLVSGKEDIYCFTCNDAGRDVVKNISPTLRAGNNGGAITPAVVLYNSNTFDGHAHEHVARALRTNGFRPDVLLLEYNPTQNRKIYITPDISPTVSSKWAKGSGGPAGDECQNLIIELYENHAQDSRVTGPHSISPTISAKYGTGGGNVPIVHCIQGEIASGRRQDQNGLGISENISFSLLSDKPHAVSQEAKVRRLMPVECERLQGFPDDWTRISWRGKPEEDCPDSHRYKAIGNSMAVPVMQWIGMRILKMKQSERNSERSITKTVNHDPENKKETR